MRNVLNFAKRMGRTSPGLEPTLDTALTPSADMAPAGSTGSPAPAPPALAAPSQLGRAERLKTQLDATLDQLQHARADADQLYALIADLEAGARLTADLAARRDELANSLEEERLEQAALAQRNTELARELARAREELGHAQAAIAAAQKDSAALALARQREADRITTLSADIAALQAELDTAREARGRLDIDCSSLRTALAERDAALRALQIKESEMRLRAEKDAAEITQLLGTTERKERKIVELGNLIDANARQIEELEERCERAREDQRQAENRHADLQVSSESRIFALTGSLSQEKAGHRVTRKLLEEMRSQSQALADQNTQMKDQTVALAQENQQIKLELAGTRGTIRDYGDRLGELNLRYSAAQDDIERLEGVIAENKKEARRLKRRAAKVDDLQTENASLHEKIKSLQHTLEQYRAGGARAGDAPVALEPRRRSAAGEAPEDEVRPASGPVAHLPRAT